MVVRGTRDLVVAVVVNVLYCSSSSTALLKGMAVLEFKPAS